MAMELELLPVSEGLPAQPRVRVLDAEQIESLRPIFEAANAVPPDPGSSFVVGTIDPLDGHVTSFLVVQLRVHAEPMWIEPGNEHVFRSLVNAAEATLQQRVGSCEVFLFAPAGKVARMAEVAGMRQEPWVVYSKQVEGAMLPPDDEDDDEDEEEDDNDVIRPS